MHCFRHSQIEKHLSNCGLYLQNVEAFTLADTPRYLYLLLQNVWQYIWSQEASKEEQYSKVLWL
jgi:hypothetical protein